MKVSVWQWIAVYAIVLPIVLLFFGARLEFEELHAGLLAANVLLALLMAAVATVILLVLSWPLASITKQIWRAALSRIAFSVVRRAVERCSKPVQAESIGERNGELVIRLPLGEDSGMALGQGVRVVNLATEQLLGVLELLSVEKSSCVCVVSDRISLEFWEGLDERRRTDFRPPGGVLFYREIPEGFLDFAERIIPKWRG